ncbi:MAG: T9SS type A sorting domain-containing protein [candidate division WOR-3 bacterium]
MPVRGGVKLLLYDVSGRVEAVIRNEELNPGYYREVFGKQKRSLPAGVHFLVLVQESKQVTRKVVLVE